MIKSKRCDIQPEQVKKELDQATKSADSIRAGSLQKLQRMRSSKIKSQEREQKRLSTKLGDSHPRVIALQAKIATNYEVVRNLKIETVRAQTVTPVVESDSWLVHGRVLQQLEPVPGMKTALYDRSGCPVDACGNKVTDKTGYFNLTIKNVSEITEKQSVELFVYVLDKDDVVQHRDKRPLTVVAGQAQYLEIDLGEEGIDRPPRPNTRYLGNSNSKELHDLTKEKPGCQIDEIKAKHRVSFKTQKEALELGYDFCAYCFGKDKSKR
jgi:hypothetical protein